MFVPEKRKENAHKTDDVGQKMREKLKYCSFFIGRGTMIRMVVGYKRKNITNYRVIQNLRPPYWAEMRNVP